MPDDDHDLAAAIASRAGDLLHGLPPHERVNGDLRSQALILGLLAEARPDDAVLAEEGVDDAGRLSSPRVWIVDPLDGTREYREGDRSDWAVHVALWSGGNLVAGAVALPAQGTTFATGAEQRVLAPPCGRMVVSRTRPPPVVDAVALALDLEVVAMGSAGAKVMAVVSGEADVYLHGGGQYEWDSAAPVAVARWHGLHASRLDGSPLEYNQPNPYLPDLVVCRPDMAGAVLATIATFPRESKRGL